MRGLLDKLRGKEAAPAATPAAANPSQRPPAAQQRPLSRPANGAATVQGARAAPTSSNPAGTSIAQQRNPARPAPSGGGDESIPATSRNRTKEASKEEVVELLSFNGEVLTAPGSVAEITENQRQYVAMLDSRKLVVSRSHAMNHDVSSVRSLLRRKGIVWKHEYHVDLDVVRKIYETAEKRRSGGGGGASSGQQMQREFLGLIAKAAAMKASDVHVVVQRYEAIVEFRSDGTLMKFQDLTASTALELCQAAFAMSDVSDPTYMPMEQQGSRVTQTSLKSLSFPEGVQSVRLQFSPLPNGGRYMVARLLYENKAAAGTDVDVLGYAPEQIRQIREMRKKPEGLNVISGPTGSGKSTTLQICMISLMRERPGINTVTVEDPPEYVIPGAKQIPVANASTPDERTIKFRQAMNGVLRLDPDVIMVGEIRDGVSAHLAFEAAMSGHCLWTSLHTNDAVSILDRLRDMGTEVYKLSDASLVTGLIGQRLVRKINPERSIGFDKAVSKGFVEERLADTLRRLVPAGMLAKIRFADTANLLDNTVFEGRTVVAETICPDQRFLDFWKVGEKPAAVAYWLNSLRGITMLEHGFVKVCQGIVDPREIQAKINLLDRIDPSRVDRIFEIHG